MSYPTDSFHTKPKSNKAQETNRFPTNVALTKIEKGEKEFNAPQFITKRLAL